MLYNKIRFSWIKRYAEIFGNELADKSVSKVPYIPVSYQQISKICLKSILHKISIEQWKEGWISTNKETHLKTFIPQLDSFIHKKQIMTNCTVHKY